jgi:hypothetical protein
MKTRVVKGIRLVVFLAGAAILPSAGFGAEPKEAPPGSVVALLLPKAREIIDRYVSAIGGKEVILKATAMRGKGAIRSSGQGQSAAGEFEVLRAKPNKQIVKVNIANSGQTVSGFDGQVGWLLLPSAGPVLLQGRMLDQARDESEFYSPLHEEKNFQRMETVGIAPFWDRDCYEVELVYKSGRKVTEYFDIQSGLLMGYRGAQETPQLSVEVNVQLADYQKFGELLQPAKLVQRVANVEHVITISIISYEPVPDKEFEMPPEVKALLKAAAETPAKPLSGPK